MLQALVCCLTKGGSFCCGLFSFIAAVFLALLGVVLTYQWEFIEIEDAEKNHELARNNALVVAIIYGVITCICIFFYFKHLGKEAVARRISQQGVELEDISIPLMPSDQVAGNGDSLYQRSTRITTT